MGENDCSVGAGMAAEGSGFVGGGGCSCSSSCLHMDECSFIGEEEGDSVEHV